ncbi:MAG: thiolase family protein [Myxococcota bacterium]
MKFDNSAKDAVIALAHRTAIGRGKKGSLALTRPDDLMIALLRGMVEKMGKLGLKPEQVDDVLVGCAMPEGEQGLNIARIVALGAGLPDSVSAATINRFCSSGVETIATAAAKIAAGHADILLAGGVESMSMVPMSGNKPSMSPDLADRLPDVYVPMGITAENVASRFNITRKEQDELAVKSHQKATMAVEKNHFAGEIIPVQAVGFDAHGNHKDSLFSKDELIRPDTSLEGLGALKPAFMQSGGTVTAGNSSPISDGAACALVMSRATADKLGVAPIGVLRGYATAGVDPAIMGIGPVPAIRKLLGKHGGAIGEIDVVELNEAFASQAAYCQRELGVSDAQLNPNGGAIALGHPLGATGARMTATLLHELGRRKGRFGIVSMCIGGGMGAAALYERV